jgi:hypothetical protein
MKIFALFNSVQDYLLCYKRLAKCLFYKLYFFYYRYNQFRLFLNYKGQVIVT